MYMDQKLIVLIKSLHASKINNFPKLKRSARGNSVIGQVIVPSESIYQQQQS